MIVGALVLVRRRGRVAASTSAKLLVRRATAGGHGAGQARRRATAGRVTGTVTLTTANSARSPATAYDRRAVAPRAKALPESRNVVIFFDGIAARSTLAAMKASIAQRDEQFVPHVVAVTDGSSVSFPNDDPFFHNVFSLSRGATFDLGRFPSGAVARGSSRSPASSRCSATFTRT